MKALIFVLASFVVAIHTKANVEIVNIQDCGKEHWRIYDAQIVNNANCTNVTANIIQGRNSSTVHEIHIHLPECNGQKDCEKDHPPNVTVRNINCRNANLTDLNKHVCQVAKGIEALERQQSTITNWYRNFFGQDVCLSYNSEEITEE